MRRRVVVTGMGGLSPIGCDWRTAGTALREMRTGVKRMADWAEVNGLRTNLAGPVLDFQNIPEHYPRKKTRTMGRVALLATRASELALEDAGLLHSGFLQSGRFGVSYGSTYGSIPAYESFFSEAGLARSIDSVSPVGFIHFMAHTCAANISQFFSTKGRVVPTTCACTAGSQGIGYAFEAIRDGYQDGMIAGGADELHFLAAAVFDLMFSTSTRNDHPESTPRPFDRDRDGLVVAEGAATLILESLEHARFRGAKIYAEVLGWSTNCDGDHIVHPSGDGMERVIRDALADAAVDPSAIDYVNLHGTATEVGDIEESQATWRVFRRPVPASSIKGYMGHTLGACGAIEAWLCLNAMREGWVPPNLNFAERDLRCGDLGYLRAPADLSPRIIMSNNFAFGGVNTSIIFKKWPD